MFLYFVSIVLIYAVVLFFKFKKNKEDDSAKWEMIGEVIKIFIYPLDGGPPLELKRAMCTKNGLGYNGMVDRTIIPYLTSTKSAMVNLDNKYSNNYYDDYANLFRKLKNATLRFNREMKHSVKKPDEIEIDYFGVPIKVVPFPTSAALAMVLQNLSNGVQLCYFNGKERRKFIKTMKEKLKNIQHIVKGISSYYSNFTIIDTESFQELQNRIASKDLTDEISFNPQLVVKGNIPYNATDLRIINETSKIEFTNIIPCNIAVPTLQDCCCIQTYGFNMEVKRKTLIKQKTMVQVGDQVYIKKKCPM